MNDKESRGKLKSAVMRGDFKTARRLVKGGTSVNDYSYQQNWETSLLHEAVISSNADIVKLLLKEGSRVNVTDMNKDTPLHLACGRENNQIVKALLAHNAKLNTKNEIGYTALDVAMKRRSPEVVHSLVCAGAQPELHSQRGSVSALCDALNNPRLRHLEIMQLLLDKGHRINSHNLSRVHACLRSAMQISDDASEILNPVVLKLLVNHGADLFYSGHMKAQMAMWIAYREYFKHFITKNNSNGTYTQVLNRCNDRDTVEYLQLTNSQDSFDIVLHFETESHDIRKNQSDNRSKDKLHSIISNTGRLSNMCRLCIRRHLVTLEGKDFRSRVQSLPLPSILIDYLQFKEILDLLCTNS